MKSYVKAAAFFIICFSLFSLCSSSQTITSDTTLANQYSDLAYKCENDFRFDTAIFYAEKARDLNIRYFGEKSLKNAGILFLLGKLYSENNKYDLALDYSLKALKTRKEILGEQNADVAASYGNIGIVYDLKGEYDKAWEYHSKALQLRKEIFGEKHPDVAESYNSIGEFYYATGEYDKALEYHFKALQIDKEILGERHSYVAKIYNNIGNIYDDQGEYDKALEYHFKALQIRKEIHGEKHTDVASRYYNIGNVYENKGEYDKALEYHFKALQISKEILGEKHFYVANSYNCIGNIYSDKGENDKALEYYSRALQISKEIFGEKHTDVANGYNNIGNEYYAKGEYDNALGFFSKALQIRKEILGEKHPDVASSYNNIAIIYADKGESDNALEYFFRALQIRKEALGEEHPEVAGNYDNIANVYADKGEYDKALEYHFKSLQINKEILGGKHTAVASSYNDIGETYEKTGKHDLALEYYQKGVASCLRNFNDTANVYSIPVISNILDWNYLLQSLQAKAEILADKSKILKDIAYKERKKVALMHYEACDTLIDLTRKELSTQSDKLAFGERANQIYKEVIDILTPLEKSDNAEILNNISDKDAGLAFYFSEKNKSTVLLEALAGQEAQKYAGIPDSLLQKEHNLKSDIAFYTKKLVELEISDSVQVAFCQNILFQRNRTYDSLINVFEKQFPEYHNLKYNTKTVTVKDIQKLLDKKTAMISYFVGDSTITSFILTSSNLYVRKVPEIKNLNDSIIWFRYGLTKTSPRMQEIYRRLGNKLYQQLFPKDLLADKLIESLIIIPDGSLAIIPFESLLTEKYTGDINTYDEYPYLIKKYNVSYSYSANLFSQTFNKKPASEIEMTKLNDWLAFAPVFDDSGNQNLSVTSRELQRQLRGLGTDSAMVNRSMFDRDYITPLPATETETESIFRIFDESGLKAKLLLHDDASERFIKSGQLANYKVLHFATHGFVNSEKPELSGLLLARDSTGGEDGILYSGEIYNLKLNADLVVLSACETGLGKIQKGEGIIGLTRALLYAGARNIIVSLWQVADESTSDLMVDFYKDILAGKGGLSYSKALRNAKLKLISGGKYAHPLFWSPFILIGK